MSSRLIVGALMACAAFAAGTAVGWSVAWLASPVADRVRSTPRARSILMAQLRTLPLAAAIVLTVSQVHAFVRFEQSRVESAGPLLIVLATLGLLLIGDASWQAIDTWRSTRATVRAMRGAARQVALPGWVGSAWLLRTPVPVVLVAGFFSPQLFIARRVLRHCTREEFAAIVAHEAAHVRAHDNLVQYLFRMTPGARLVPGFAATLEREWRVSTEEAADQSAGVRAGYLELASALTKVARLMPTSPPLVASALIGESNLDTRVRRLLLGGAKAPPSTSAIAPPSRNATAPSSPNAKAPPSTNATAPPATNATAPPATNAKASSSVRACSEGATLVAPPVTPCVAVWLPILLVLASGVTLQVPAVGAALHEMFELLVRPY